jgi:thiol-disulfide isomerase/thioredoxin
MERKRLYLAGLVLIVIIALVLVFAGTGKGTPGAALVAFDNQPVPQSVLADLHVPNSVATTVGVGLASNFPVHISGKPLTLNGKPEILYIGSEFCPYCAVERWGLVIALMRFGNFTGLKYMTSSPTDVGPNTPTFTFIGAQYTSNYISFVTRELVNNVVNASTGQYTTLQTLNTSLTALTTKYNPNGSIPFVDYANESTQVGANYNDPTILANMNWSTIAGMLQNSNSTQSLALIGSANVDTAQICKILNNTPSSVCGQGYIKSIESELG